MPFSDNFEQTSFWTTFQQSQGMMKKRKGENNRHFSYCFKITYCCKSSFIAIILTPRAYNSHEVLSASHGLQAWFLHSGSHSCSNFCLWRKQQIKMYLTDLQDLHSLVRYTQFRSKSGTFSTHSWNYRAVYFPCRMFCKFFLGFNIIENLLRKKNKKWSH